MIFGRIVLGILLPVAAATDLARRRIPNLLIGLGLGAFLLTAARLAYYRESAMLAGCLSAGVLAFGIHLIPYRRKVMGAGDVKMALVVGLLLGWEGWLGYLQMFCLVALFASALLLASGRKGKSTLPLAPFMAAAYFLHQFSVIYFS